MPELSTDRGETAPLKLMDPMDVIVGPLRMLETTTNPRHRDMICNYVRHALLEISGRWDEVLERGTMIVANPQYRINSRALNLVLDGYDEVAALYRAAAEAGDTPFSPLQERVAVADWGLAIEALLAHHQRGWELVRMGVDVDEVDGFYQLEHWVSSFWIYDEHALLVGERVYEDVGSRVIRRITESDYVSQSEAAARLAPLIEGDRWLNSETEKRSR